MRACDQNSSRPMTRMEECRRHDEGVQMAFKAILFRHRLPLQYTWRFWHCQNLASGGALVCTREEAKSLISLFLSLSPLKSSPNHSTDLDLKSFSSSSHSYSRRHLLAQPKLHASLTTRLIHFHRQRLDIKVQIIASKRSNSSHTTAGDDQTVC